MAGVCLVSFTDLSTNTPGAQTLEIISLFFSLYTTVLYQAILCRSYAPLQSSLGLHTLGMLIGLAYLAPIGHNLSFPVVQLLIQTADPVEANNRVNKI